MITVIGFAIQKRSLWSAFGLVVIVALSWLQHAGYLLPDFREIFELKHDTITMSFIVPIGISIFGYLLIGTAVALAVNIFKPLKSVSEYGLVKGLLVGLVGILVCGLVGILVRGLILGIVWSFALSLVAGLVASLAVSLILIFYGPPILCIILASWLGFIEGLESEFD